MTTRHKTKHFEKGIEIQAGNLWVESWAEVFRTISSGCHKLWLLKCLKAISWSLRPGQKCHWSLIYYGWATTSLVIFVSSSWNSRRPALPWHITLITWHVRDHFAKIKKILVRILIVLINKLVFSTQIWIIYLATFGMIFLCFILRMIKSRIVLKKRPLTL